MTIIFFLIKSGIVAVVAWCLFIGIFKRDEGGEK